MSAPEDRIPPPASSVVADPAEPVKIAQDVTTEKNAIIQAEGENAKAKIKAQPGLGNYFVSETTPSGERYGTKSQQRVFSYGTSLDVFLMGLSCLTSIGSGIVSHSASIHDHY